MIILSPKFFCVKTASYVHSPEGCERKSWTLFQGYLFLHQRTGRALRKQGRRPPCTIILRYSGEFQDGRFSGQGEKTDYYTEEQAAEKGYSRITYSGGFRDGKYSGQGEETYYQTEEYAAEYGYSRRVFKGTYSDGALNGEAELTVYYTKEYAAANGIDYVVRSGEYRDNGFSGSQRYTFYKDGKAIEAGTVKDGKYVSDTDKALNDAIYDGLRDAVGDGIMGDLFDIFGPAFYDRYGN